MKRYIILFIIFLCYTGKSFGYGPHDPNCISCHSLHDAKAPKIIAIEPYNKEINPVTKTKPTGIASLCMGCHNTDMGIKPVTLTHSNPVEIVPIGKVDVPPSLLKDSKVTCSSCHNPHESDNERLLLV